MIFCIKEVGRKGHGLVHLCWSRFGFSMPVRVASFWADISVTKTRICLAVHLFHGSHDNVKMALLSSS